MTLTVVTGASGFVGGVLVRSLLDRGRPVRVVDTVRGPSLDGLEVEFRPADVTDATTLRLALDGADSVFHLAAIISISGDPTGRVRAVNVDGVRNTATAALEAGVRRFVHCSSVHAFDLAAADDPLTEESPRSLGPHLPAYDRSKAAGEEELRAVIDGGLDAVVVNPTGVIGPEDFTPSRMGHVFKSMFRGKVPALVGGAFDWVDVRDVAAGMLAAETDGRTGENYLLPGNRASMSDFADIIERVAGARKPRLTLPMWLAEASAPLAEREARLRGRPQLFTREALHALKSDPIVPGTKARTELGYMPRPLADSVADTYAWFNERDALEAT